MSHRAAGPAGPRIGLAFGGGGARGFAHIVVLEALDALGLRPAILAGTSMGALVGAVYAAGMTGADLRRHVLRQTRSRRLVLGRLLEARVGRFADILRRGLVNPILLDLEHALPLFWPGPMPATFADLAIPMLVVATDLDAREEVVIGAGSLPDALAASAAIPGLIRPVRREGRLLVDGGAVNPLPYDLLVEEADLVIACDVAAGRTDTPAADPRPFAVMLGAAQIMQTALTARMLRAQRPHLLLRPPVERFRLLDFFQAARILEAADTALDDVKRSIDGLLTNAVPSTATPKGAQSGRS